jgi:hypothetical protein
MSQPENAHGGHGHEQEVQIIVNGRPRAWKKDEISFAEVVALAFETPPYGENTLFSVTYRRGHGNKPEGILAEGDPPVKVKDGMIFDVTATDKS